MARARNICFTINNYTEKQMDALDLLTDCNYLIYGYEIGDKGTPHVQGYIEFSEGRSYETIKDLLQCNWVHLEPRKGTSKQASDYCKKDSTFYEFGERSKQGARSDIKAVTDAIIAGDNLTDIAITNPETWIKYTRGFRDLKTIVMPHRSTRPLVLWYYGETGRGKSYEAMHYTGDINDIYKKPNIEKNGMSWWDGYEQQKVILIDDIDAWYPIKDLKELLDENPLTCQTKGGTVKINSPIIIITSDRRPEDVFESLKGNELAQLLDRITSIKHFDGPNRRVKASTSVPQKLP